MQPDKVVRWIATTAAGTAAKCGDKLAVEAGFGWDSTAPLALHRNLFFCALANSNKMPSIQSTPEIQTEEAQKCPRSHEC